VLVVKDQYLPDVIQIKIADFASACFGGSEDEPVKVSRTEPWDAPEWHPRSFLLKDAKKMDIYSFGLLCLWLFFRHDNMNELGPGITVGMAFSGQDPGLTAKLQTLKRDGDAMLDCAFRLTNQSHDIEEDARDSLLKALPLALQSDPNKRQLTIEAFVRLLCTGERLKYVLESIPAMCILNWRLESS
jgi:serine/threonine protein kinase